MLYRDLRTRAYLLMEFHCWKNLKVLNNEREGSSNRLKFNRNRHAFVKLRLSFFFAIIRLIFYNNSEIDKTTPFI